MFNSIIKLRNLSSSQMMFLILISSVLLGLDQVSKKMALDYYELTRASIEVLPFFNITFIINYGISFSMFNGLDYKVLLLLSSVAFLMAIIIVISLWENIGYLQLTTLSLLIAGSCGNLIDRYTYQGVIDFLHIYYQDWHFPIFNLADCFVSCAGIIIFIEIFLKKSYNN